jgi:uncharacterized protein
MSDVSEIDNAIIVFARLPVKGRVKTRLAKELGIDVATSFYKVCAEHTFKEILKFDSTQVVPFLFFSEESEIDEMRNWTKNKFRYYSQKGHDLGERMSNAFNTIFDAGYRNVILVGTDAPGISAELITDAFSQLKDYNCVIGPSEDGGYYLMGLKQKLFYLFNEMEWSTNAVFSRTIERLKQNNHDYTLMQKMIDIDTKEDLKKWSDNYKSVCSQPIKNFLTANNLIIKE